MSSSAEAAIMRSDRQPSSLIRARRRSSAMFVPVNAVASAPSTTIGSVQTPKRMIENVVATFGSTSSPRSATTQAAFRKPTFPGAFGTVVQSRMIVTTAAAAQSERSS